MASKAYNLPSILKRMIKAERENKKRIKILRESPIVIRQRAKEDKARARIKIIKKTDDLIFEGMT